MDKSKKYLQEDRKAMRSKLGVSNNHNFKNGGGRTSTSDEENGASRKELNKNHHRRLKSNSCEDEDDQNGEMQDDIIEIDSEDSRDAIRHNNNNEEALPDRHRAYEDEENQDTDRESTSSDIVVVRDDYQDSRRFCEDIEELSRINTSVQLHTDDKVSIENFKIHKLLGTGAYGKVFSVEKLTGKDKGHVYAMKVLEKFKVTQKKKTTEHTRTEREVLEKVIDCPFLATLYYAFQTSEKLYLIMEFVQGGELFSHLYRSENFDENQVRFYIAEIVVALEQLHEKYIIYRDIKLENILLDKDGHIIITDFGLSKELKDGGRTNSYCGTIEYMAPEIVNPKNGHDLNVDWWSVGVLIIELLSGQSPFSRDNEESNQSVISDRIQNSAPNIPDNVGPEAKDLILRLLEKDPRNRLGYKNDAADIKNHKFFRDIDWDVLKQKNYDALMIPTVADKFDVSQFSEDFTNQKAEDLPSEHGPPKGPNASKYFRGYSFVAPMFRTKTVAPDLQIVDKPEMNRPSIEDVFRVQSKRKSPFFNKYQIYEESALIGDGTYSLCMECVSLKRKEKKFAVKILKLSHDASQEIAALKKCQGHLNVVKLVETMKDDNFTYIVCELLSGDELFSRISKRNFLNEDVARVYFLQIVDAVTFMHSKSIIHRDLKPENIKFVDNNSTEDDEVLKILDFGFAHQVTSEETPPCFTLDYAAPESLAKGATKETRDMWSLGVILYTMLIGNTPFKPQAADQDHDDRNFRIQITENIRKGNFNTDNRWDDISDEAKDLIANLLKVNESERLTMDEVKLHPWIEKTEQEYSNGSNDTIIINEEDDQQQHELDRVDSDATIHQDYSIEDIDADLINEEEKIQLTKAILSKEEIRKSNDDSSSGIVVSEPNEGSSSVSENDDSKKDLEENEPSIIDEPEEIQQKMEDNFNTSHHNEQLEPENLSLKPADLNKAEKVEPVLEVIKTNKKKHYVEEEELPFKGFNSLVEAAKEKILCGFGKETVLTKELFVSIYYRKLFQTKHIASTVLPSSNRRSARLRVLIAQSAQPLKVTPEKVSRSKKTVVKMEPVCIEPVTSVYNKGRGSQKKLKPSVKVLEKVVKPMKQAKKKANKNQQTLDVSQKKENSRKKKVVKTEPVPVVIIEMKEKRPRRKAAEKAQQQQQSRELSEKQKKSTAPSRKRKREVEDQVDNKEYEPPKLRRRRNNDTDLTVNKTAKNLPEKKKEVKKPERSVRVKKEKEHFDIIVTKMDESATKSITPPKSRKRKIEPVSAKATKKARGKKEKVEVVVKTSPKRDRGRLKVEKKAISNVIVSSLPPPPNPQKTCIESPFYRSFFSARSSRKPSPPPAPFIKPEPKHRAIIIENVLLSSARLAPPQLSCNYIENRSRHSMIISRHDSFLKVKTESDKSPITTTMMMM